jgi:hypothetical protein
MGQEQGNKVRQPVQEPEATEFSNAVRLTLREWLVVGLFTAALVFLAPPLWKQVEPLDPSLDERMPHDLSNDYWLYSRYAEVAAERCDTVLIGDSVIWGEYVRPGETLSHYLNELGGRRLCANLGLDGAHPLALAGLVEYYARSVRDRDVILECNPLWLTSPRRDLQDPDATDFNHPRLVPQFVRLERVWPVPQLFRLLFRLRLRLVSGIPSYHADWSTRIGVVVGRHLPVSGWANHLQQTYYEGSDIPSWTLDHPYDDPVKPVTRGLPPPDNSLRHLPQPWYKSGIGQQDFPWVDLETSLQWQGFRRAVKVLQERGNRVFVLVGPFNEHLLTPASLQRYRQVKATITAWLAAEGVPHAAPAPLRSELYGDASHPLAGGYEELARQLLDEPFFRQTGPSTASAR